jgi:mono/diheme cytochrome c family protein
VIDAMHRKTDQSLLLLFTVALIASAPSLGSAQQPAVFFRQNCMSCHTIGGGRITGPDLKDVTQRKDRAWLEKFVQNPKAAIDAGDPYALQLQQEARGVLMPTVPGINPDVARALIDFIEAESKLPRSQFAGATISDRPLTATDVAIGRQLFFGTRPLANGGPACSSCHTLGTFTGLGGGRLGPDLTRVYERLGGRKAVGMWLSAPATPTMQAVFRKSAIQPDEILPLLAVMEDAGKQGREADQSSLLKFFLIGFGGMVAGLAILERLWRGRLRAVRSPLVHHDERGEA